MPLFSWRKLFRRPVKTARTRPTRNYRPRIEGLEERVVPALTSPHYAPPTNFATASQPYGVVTGDLDRDGKIDVVTVNYATSTISVLLGNGDGTFQQHRDVPVAADPHGLTLGDFNGDGILDVATASASRNVSVFLGNGDGTFGARVDYGTEVPVFTAQARDVTGDGRQDLLAFHTQYVIYVLVGNGDGSFQAPVDFVNDAFQYALGDLNGDGRDDLVSIGNDQTALQVRLADAAGAFQTPALYYPGGYLDTATINDFNRDGKLDIAIAGGYHGTLSVMLGNGDGTFQGLTSYDAGLQPTDIHAVDLNGDNVLDLAVFNSNVPGSFTFLLGNGSGGFGPATSYPMPRGTFSLAFTDFNNDGVPDLVAGNLDSAAITVLLSQSSRVAIDAGGSASGSFLADAGFTGGTNNGTTASIATAGVVNAAPQDIYQTERVGNFSYSCADLTPGVRYTVRLHFAELTWSAVDQRRFNVAINGAPVLTNFDVFAEAGGRNVALVVDFVAVADASGEITITFESVKDNATVSGIEIIGAVTPPPLAPPAEVTNVSAIAGAGQLKLNWAAVGGAARYRVYRRSSAGATMTYDLAGTTFTDRGLSSGTTYFYQVSAINGGGEGPKSTEVSATPLATAETVWVDDRLPAGAVAGAEGGDAWTWIAANPAPYSGALASQSNLAAGQHQHFFTGATDKLLVQQSDKLFAYVYLDPANPPTEIMLQWHANGSWEHRAYWGANSLTWGTNGSNSRRSMGALPAAGGWVRLEVSAAQVGLEGLAIDGMAFTLFNGRATWDQAGKVGAAANPPAVPTLAAATVASGQVALNWTAVTGTTSYNVYRSTGSASAILYRTGLTTTSFTDTGLTNGVRYAYRVTAVNAAGESARSNEVAAMPQSLGEVVWVKDALPAGAVVGAAGGDAWTWVSGNPSPFAGTLAHQSNLASGIHQHFFTGATDKLVVQAGDTLFAYVYLDPANPPTEIMLQWFTQGNWEHRAYWGADQITAWGKNGTVSRRSMGALPAAGGWVRLEVPAALVGLEGATVEGMAFTLYGGRATWDQAGKSSAAVSPPPAPTVAPPNVGNRQVILTWSAPAGATSYNVYRSTSSGGAGSTPYRTGITAPSFTDTGLSNGTSYFYQVTAVNSGGESAKSMEVGATPHAATETVWVDDALPVGAVAATEGGDVWNWVSSNPAPVAGVLAHQSTLAAGMHQHFFTGATDKLLVQQGDKLFAYVYLDPANPPTEIMLQWRANGSWEHRAYWGANTITWGTNGTNSRRFMGALPAAGGWVRLEVAAALLGLEGSAIDGMAFTLYGGRATWDKAGKAA